MSSWPCAVRGWASARLRTQLTIAYRPDRIGIRSVTSRPDESGGLPSRPAKSKVRDCGLALEVGHDVGLGDRVVDDGIQAGLVDLVPHGVHIAKGLSERIRPLNAKRGTPPGVEGRQRGAGTRWAAAGIGSCDGEGTHVLRSRRRIAAERAREVEALQDQIGSRASAGG